MNELVSIVVPVFNAEKYLERCIKSISEQIYSNIEIILVDDGSTDNSKKICELWKKKDNRIQYIYQENAGVSSARNIGIDSANGDYIVFVDADDYLDINFICYMMSFQKDNDFDLIISNAIDVYDNGKTDEMNFGSEMVLLDKNEAAVHFLASDLFSSVCWGRLYKKSIVNLIRFDLTMRIAEDSRFLWSAINACQKICVVPERHYFYYIHSASVIHSGFSEKYYDELKFCKELTEMNKGKGRLERESELKRYIFIRRLLDMDGLPKYDRHRLIGELRISHKCVKKYFSSKNYMGYYRFLLKNIIRGIN